MNCSVYYYELRLKIHVFLGSTVSTETLNFKTFNSLKQRLNLAKFLKSSVFIFGSTFKIKNKPYKETSVFPIAVFLSARCDIPCLIWYAYVGCDE
jgi:hypothetical protein